MAAGGVSLRVDLDAVTGSPLLQVALYHAVVYLVPDSTVAPPSTETILDPPAVLGDLLAASNPLAAAGTPPQESPAACFLFLFGAVFSPLLFAGRRS